MKWGKIGLAVLTAVQCQVAFAAPSRIDTGFFPIDITPTAGTSVDDLFPTQPRIGTNPPPIAPSQPGTGSPIIINPNPSAPSTPSAPNQPSAPVVPPTAGTNGNGLPVIVKDSTGVADEFKCNLFTNSDDKTYSDILSAINSLNQAVSSPSCSGNQINQQAVVDNNKKIQDAIEKLQPYLHSEEEIPKEKVPEIVSNVDIAIRAASTLASTFSSTDLMNKNCRQQMNGGQIALAINDMINGLTPYALMAASMTGGTAAIPFIVGGQVLTSAIGSMEKIVNENSTKIADPTVRRAVLENTCQYIRLEQKYRFLTRGRDEQVSKISKEMLKARNYSSKLSGVSKETNNLMDRKSALSAAAFELNAALASTTAEAQQYRDFVKASTPPPMVCELGINLALAAKDSNSSVAKMLGSVNYSLAATGYSATPITGALKNSATGYIQALQNVNARSNVANCALTATYLVDVMDKSAVASREIMKQAQVDLDKELRKSPEYSQIQTRLAVLAEKQAQAARITNSLDNLRKYANAFSQSEIDSEMARLRTGLFETRTLGINSPVMAWFNYTSGLHRGAIAKFKEGVRSLQDRAFRMTESGQFVAVYNGQQLPPAKVAKDRAAANNLETLVPALLVKDSRAYADTCRETQDVWNRWVSAVDHLQAIESFCQMIDNYIYDNRSEDQSVVEMCRGTQAARGVGSNMSQLGQMKTQLLNEYTNNWASLVKKRITALGCQTVTTF